MHTNCDDLRLPGWLVLRKPTDVESLLKRREEEGEVNLLGFAEPGILAPDNLAGYYDELHSLTTHTVRDHVTGIHHVWRYPDVEAIIKGTPAVSNRNTLNPLTPVSRFVANPPAWRHLAYLATVPKATANANDPAHADVRRAVFSRPDGLSLRPDITNCTYGDLIRQRAEAAADGLTAGTVVDLAETFARPLASGVISAIVGFSHDDETEVRRWSDAQTSLLGRVLNSRDQITGVRGLRDIARACRELVTARHHQPTGDLASHLISRGLTPKLAAATLMNIVAAGYSTSYSTILNSLRYLLSDSGRTHWWDSVLDEPRDLATELLRVETGLICWKRFAKGDVRLADGSTIPAGQQILVMLGAANRDPRHFPEPHRIHPRSHDGTRTLTFGTGPHLCVGREIAVLELMAALTALRNRYPEMRLAAGEVKYDADYLFRTPSALLVHLG